MRAFIFASLVTVTTLAQAEFKDGNKLLSELNHEVFYTRGVAMGYIMGVADAGAGGVHCAPPNVTAGQLQDMVKNYLENTPAERRAPMACPASYQHFSRTL